MQPAAKVFVVIALVAGSLPAAAEEAELTDRVGTLQLSAELDTRGNLGGITVDRLGYIYVANFRDAVWRITPDGEVREVSRALYGASGNVVDSRGDLYQANFFANTILRIGRDGSAKRFVDQGLNGPVGLAVDSDDNLYVCNCSGNYISRVSRDGEVEEFSRSELFACPNGLTFGPDGNLYVTNFNHVDLVRVSADGEASRFTTVPGGAGNAHIAFSKGFFYVTKIIAHRVFKVSLEGEATPLAGTGQPGHDDGSALEATLHRPNGIAVSPSGRVLYINTLLGEFSTAKPSRISIRSIELVTLTDVLEEALAAGGVEALEPAYRRYSAHPVRGKENTIAEMVTYGYKYLSSRQVPEALAIFELNAAAHPDAAAAQYHLGEAYRYTGRSDDAIAQYRKTLTLDPENRLAKDRLRQLGAE